MIGCRHSEPAGRGICLPQTDFSLEKHSGCTHRYHPQTAGVRNDRQTNGEEQLLLTVYNMSDLTDAEIRIVEGG